ncbi:MAG: ribonuclease P protein component [Phycisphaerae bacterium]|nr:ribonuclease P protein component [Phycisphaerae bacterium]
MNKYGKNLRISNRGELTQLFRRGVRVGDNRILLIGLPTETPTRGAVAISVRHGGAVKRNRLKRVIREAFRLERANLPENFDFVISPRVGVDCDLAQLRQSLAKLAPRVAEKAAKNNS